jgi:hypothetical protein
MCAKSARFWARLLEKAAQSPLFPHKSKAAFPKLKFWESLNQKKFYMRRPCTPPH